MTADTALRVGWCPGALRPMEAGDGMIVRVKPRCGTLDLTAAAALADLAAGFGNGAIDLTSRANLQIRGVRADGLAALTAALDDLGLLDTDPDSEAIRNIVVSPLAGIDPGVADVRRLAAAIERRYAADRTLRHLPAKWSVVVDGGGTWTLAAVSADLRFEVAGRTAAVGLGADPCRAFCAAEDVAGIAVALGRWAVARGSRRMVDLIRERGAVALFQAVGLTQIGSAIKAAESAGAPLGLHRFGSHAAFGVAAPFGAVASSAFARLVEGFRRAGAQELRLTPWRSMIVELRGGTLTDGDGPSIGDDTRHPHAEPAAQRPSRSFGFGGDGLSSRASHLQELAQAAGFIVRADDPRLVIAACAGAPACHRATTPVRADAAELAAGRTGLTSGIAIHVSGCAKGCAHAASAPWTLVGRDGRYDVVRDGKAGDPPLARGLSLQEAAIWVSRSPHERRP